MTTTRPDDAGASPPQAPPPATPLPALHETPAPPTWRRALVLALLVLVAGAALGAAAFAAEQHYFVWEPDVTATADGGWLVTGHSGLRPAAPTLGGKRLVWGQGAYTCVLELDSGDTHVVGAAPHGTSIWPPAAGSRYVAWIEAPRGGARPHLWVYDMDRGRRQSFVVGAEAATTAVAGDLVVWYERAGDGTPRVQALDMGTGRRSTVAAAEDVDYPVFAGEGHVGWLLARRAEGAGPAIRVTDFADGGATTVPLAAGRGSSVTDVQLRGRTLVWTVGSSATTEVLVQDLDGGPAAVVASGDIVAATTDGRVVAWAERDAEGATVVRRRVLGTGGDLEPIGIETVPLALAVDGAWIAWTSSDGTWSHLEAARLAR